MFSFDGARARAIRLAAGVCVEDLAAAAGVSPNTVRAAETGTRWPRPAVAGALASALGVGLAELSSTTGNPTLSDIRRRLGMTQTQIAERVGAGRQMVSRVERGVGGVGSPAAWARAYGLSVEQWERAHRAGREEARRRVARLTGAHSRHRRGRGG